MSNSPTPAATIPSGPWFDEPSLALRERLSGAPREGVVKGWLFQSLIEGAKRQGVELEGVTRRIGFKDYPLAEYLTALAQAAVRVKPELPPVDTLRFLGQGVYASFAQSLFGKVVIAGLGSGHEGARTGLRWVAQVYKLTSNHAVASVTQTNENVSYIELRDVWTFPDSYHIGIFEGAAHAFGGKVTISVRRRAISSASFEITWNA